MAWFLFVDESGHDRRASPYEVLAGIAVRDCDLWNLINDIHSAELAHFGRRYSAGNDELKGTKILKTKVFQHARLNVPVALHEITELAKAALDDGANANLRHLKGLGLAKLAYVEDVFKNLCEISLQGYCKHCRILMRHAQLWAVSERTMPIFFERFFYWLEDCGGHEQGIIVFDELEKTKSHLLVEQTHKYFKETQGFGRNRARLIVPEPFFVHSDLTTGVQIADLIAYCISWGFRTQRMRKAARQEFDGYAKQIADLRFRSERYRDGRDDFEIWSFAHITDLRTSLERLEAGYDP